MTALIKPDPVGQASVPTVRNLPEILELIGGCRGSSLTCGMLAVLATTVEDAQDRAEVGQEFLEARGRFLNAIAEKCRLGPFLADMPEIAAPRRIVFRFNDTLAGLPDDTVTMTRADAVQLAARARREVLPALQEIVVHLSKLENEEAEAQLARVREKSVIVDNMLAEMRRIGRTIGLISINASVEAARAGGESGRSFQIIAEEVRSLAKQSSDVLDSMRSRISEGEGEENLRVKQTFR